MLVSLWALNVAVYRGSFCDVVRCPWQHFGCQADYADLQEWGWKRREFHHGIIVLGYWNGLGKKHKIFFSAHGPTGVCVCACRCVKTFPSLRKYWQGEAATQRSKQVHRKLEIIYHPDIFSISYIKYVKKLCVCVCMHAYACACVCVLPHGQPCVCSVQDSEPNSAEILKAAHCIYKNKKRKEQEIHSALQIFWFMWIYCQKNERKEIAEWMKEKTSWKSGGPDGSFWH